ncbi:MAG: hypothetical protein JJE35_11700 [Thermoleophilia bacterium]|nr:hypothetical protein [Thermoleophilia bacterium]
MQLDILPGGDVAFSQRHPVLDDVGEGLQLGGRDAAEGELDPNHLHVGLTLSVNALFKAEGDEDPVLALALEEAPGLGAEVVELVFEDRDREVLRVRVGCDSSHINRPNVKIAIRTRI